MTELPDGWRRTTLGDECEIVSGSTPKTSEPAFWDGEIPWLTPADLSKWKGTYIDGGARSLTQAGLDSCSARLFPKNTVMMSSRAPIGYTAIANRQMCTNQGFKSMLPSQSVHPEWLRYYLEHALPEIKAMSSGTTFAEISGKKLGTLPINLPPVEEQKRIVEALDAHLSRLDKALAELHEAEHNIELLIESYRHDVVSGVYSQGIDGWRHARLGEIARWGSGGTPQSGNPKYYGGSIPWCVIGDLTESDVILTEKSITDEGLAASSAKIVQPGTVLLAMYGASIGRTGLAATPMATNQAIAFAVPNPEVDPRYLLLFLQSQKRKFVHAGKGGAQPNISQTIIKDWNITFPPVEEQRRLIQQVKEHQQSMAVLMEQNYRMKNQALLLKKSLLNAAFTGELKV